MIGLIGLSHKTAPIDKRELFSISQDEVIPLADFMQQETDISFIVVLSTCNRTEIYFSTSETDRLSTVEKAISALKRFKKAENQCSRFFYHKFDSEAVSHLFNLASGLDSMVIGEDQILGQLKDAYIYCTDNALTDAVLMRLFQKAFETGKRVRTETGIALGNMSVSSVAIELCARENAPLINKSALVIGAGKTGHLALQSLIKKGIGSTTIINRTEKKALELASCFESKTAKFNELQTEIGKHEIVIVATSSGKQLISQQMVEKSKEGNNKTQIFIDLSVPRNIDIEVKKIENVKLFAVDDLQEVIKQNAEQRKNAAMKAKSIINETVNAYNDWLISRSLRPAIKSINNNLNKVYKQELENFRHFDSPETKEAVEQYTRHIIHRYSRLLVRNLKQLTNNGQNTDSLDIIKELFDIEDNNRKKK